MSLSYSNPNGEYPIAKLATSSEVKYVFVVPPDSAPKQGVGVESLLDEDLSDAADLIAEELAAGRSLRSILSEYLPEAKEEFVRPISNLPIEKKYAVAVMPAPKPERIYIAGMSGLGKSTLAAEYANQYKQMYPDNNVYLYCRTGDDPAFEGVDIMEKVVDNETTEIDETMEYFEDSLVIFDDMDNLPIKKARDSVHKLMADIMANGRKKNIYVMYLSHIIFNYAQTRIVLNEANKFIFFNAGNGKHIRKFLTENVGLPKQKAEAIMEFPTRWTCVNLLPPKHIVTESDILLL